MSTTDELLEEMLEDAEEYATPVTDDDLQFWINEHLRVISIPKNGVVAGVEGDKNVNKIKFGMNRYYHGFDMSTFSGRILYSNAKGNKNYYNITDMQESGNTITFSWLVDADAVQYMGKTAFVVYLFKTQGSELRQKFYSTLAALNVLEGMEVDSAVPVEKQTDIIERMKEEISAYAEEVKKSLPADYTAMTEQVSSLKEDIEYKANMPLTTAVPQFEILDGVMDINGDVTVINGAKRVSINVSEDEYYIVSAWKWSKNFPNYIFMNDSEIVSYVDIGADYQLSDEYVCIPNGVNRLIVNINKGLRNQIVKKINSFLNIDNYTSKINAPIEYDVPINFSYKDGVRGNEGNVVNVGRRLVASVEPNKTYKITGFIWQQPNFPMYHFYDISGKRVDYGTPEGYIIYTVMDSIIKIPPDVFTIEVNGNNGVDQCIFSERAIELDEYVKKQNFWYGKNIVWFGTSIPAGVIQAGDTSLESSYPVRIGKMLGATVYNEAVGSSSVRFGNHDYVSAEDPHGLKGQWYNNLLYSMSASSQEKQVIFDNWDKWGNIIQTGDNHSPHAKKPEQWEIDKALSCSYDKKLDKYLSGGSIGQVDLYVFDHGHNEEFNGDYSHIADLPPADNQNDRSYFIGAMRFLIERILNDNPKARICFVGHYENDRKTGISEAQLKLHDIWKFPLFKTWEHIGFSQNIINGKTITNIWMPDDLHPASDTSGEALELYAETLYPFIRDIR